MKQMASPSIVPETVSLQIVRQVATVATMHIQEQAIPAEEEEEAVALGR